VVIYAPLIGYRREFSRFRQRGHSARVLDRDEVDEAIAVLQRRLASVRESVAPDAPIIVALEQTIVDLEAGRIPPPSRRG
jgi:hypothetical protein